MKLKRVNDTTLIPEGTVNVPLRLFANAKVPVEQEATLELAELLGLQETMARIRAAEPNFFGQVEPQIAQVAITPDFHKGAGIPIGTVMKTVGCAVPQAIGNDVNCGMRLYATDLDANRILENEDRLGRALRHVFFGGGRNIPTYRRQREALLRYGLQGLLDTHSLSKREGLWAHYDPKRQEADLFLVEKHGSWAAPECLVGEKFIGGEDLRRDSQLGTIGGGNHFVEFQRVKEIFDGGTARAWGLEKDKTVVMIHSGSLMIGHAAGAFFQRLVEGVYPSGLRRPKNGIYPLPAKEADAVTWDLFWSALSNATNFAFANRLFLGLMSLACLEKEIGSADFRLVYDAPHNLVWPDENAPMTFIHRKGACPARGMIQMAKTPFAYYGEPVMIPGSMGTESFLLAGEGNADSLFSASHGAGRALSRGKSQQGHAQELKAFLERFKIITPVDPDLPEIRSRRDILLKWEEEIKREAPWAYKDISLVIETQADAGMVRKVAAFEPLLTVKA